MKEILLDQIDSTNEYAKRMARQLEDRTVIIAKTQLAGKGKLGRNWASNSNKGLWMSVFLKPGCFCESLQMVTLAASIAVVLAIRKLVGLTTYIKWPNDVMIDNKKVCGILTEARFENNKLSFIILGIGINVSHGYNDFPQEISNIATSILQHLGIDGNIDENKLNMELIREILLAFYPLYNKICTKEQSIIISTWKKYTNSLNREVQVVVDNYQSYIGTAVDITEKGALVVECEDGRRREFISGDVNITVSSK